MIASAVISVGLCSLLGVHSNFLITRVIPLFVLAFGLDNIFILSNVYHYLGQTAYMSNETRLIETLNRVGNSVTLSGFSIAMICILGTLARIPAVQTFSIYTALTAIFNYILQLTCFLSCMVIDGDRKKANRLDLIPCIKANTDFPVESNEPLITRRHESLGMLHFMLDKYFVPYIVHPVSRLIVFFLFIGILFLGINFSTELEMGLDPQELIPQNSYLVSYYNQFNKYSAAGPPLYIVLRESFDYSNRTVQNTICSVGGCDVNSITKLFDVSPYMVAPTFSWLDDYLEYAANPNCCFQKNGTRCVTKTEGCEPCFKNRRPSTQEFHTYLTWFLHQNVTEQCENVGLPYLKDIVLDSNSHIIASRFRLFHSGTKKVTTCGHLISVLKTQEDHINAMKVAFELTDNSKLDLFPFSPLYTYYEQFLYIKEVAALDIFLCLGTYLNLMVTHVTIKWAFLLHRLFL